jgi:ParB/RepB/Spo0J family partition protein
MGDIAALARGIQCIGLLEPIIVDQNGAENNYRLVAGGRRLRAVRMLRWKTISAQLLEHLSENELRDIELEENENWLPLSEGERTRTFQSSKRLLENAKKAAEVISNAPLGKDPQGRHANGGASKADLAEALNVSHAAITRAEHQEEREDAEGAA